MRSILTSVEPEEFSARHKNDDTVAVSYGHESWYSSCVSAENCWNMKKFVSNVDHFVNFTRCFLWWNIVAFSSNIKLNLANQFIHSFKPYYDLDQHSNRHLHVHVDWCSKYPLFYKYLLLLYPSISSTEEVEMNEGKSAWNLPLIFCSLPYLKITTKTDVARPFNCI